MSSPRLLIAAAALIATMSVAHARSPGDVTGYLVTTDHQPVRDSFGDCWHTAAWEPGMRFANCEPQPVKPATAASEPLKRAPKAVAETVKPSSRPKTAAPFRLSADTLFQFDSVILTMPGRAALDALGKRIADSDYRVVDISGHADRLGTPSYNRRLSERRAQSVRSYLAGRGVDAHRIRTKGVGSTEPVTSSGQCRGLPRAELIQCLQPDRYAEVTVVGTAHTASAAQ